MLGKIVETLQQSNAPDLELKTSALIEEVRLAAQDGNQDTLGRSLVALASNLELQATSDQRRAVARFVDVAVDLAGVQVCSADSCRMLLKSVSGVAAKSESVVASEVLLGILGADSELAWELLWNAVVGESSRAGSSKALVRLMVDALERFPHAALPRVCGVVVDVKAAEAQRLLGLELICEAGATQSGFTEPELVVEWVSSVAAAALVEREARLFHLFLLALTGLLRSLTRPSLRDVIGTVLSCVERALTWSHSLQASLSSAAAGLYFCAYAALPQTCLKRMHEWSDRSPLFAAATRNLLASRFVPLHEALICGGVDEDAPPDDGVTVDRCWAHLLGKTAVPLSSSVVLERSSSGANAEEKDEEDEMDEEAAWRREMRLLEERVCELAVATESVCSRAGVGALASAGVASMSVDSSSPMELRASAAAARVLLVFERLVGGKAILQAREESRFEGPRGRKGNDLQSGGETSGAGSGGSGVVRGTSVGSGNGGRGGSGVSAGGRGAVDTDTTSADEEGEVLAPTRGAALAKLHALLAAARSDLAAREGAEEALRRRVMQAEDELRNERRARKALLLKEQTDASMTTETAATASSSRELHELEAALRDAKERLRDQQQFEAELGALQLETAEWDARAAAKSAAFDDGTDAHSQLKAARLEISRLEEALLEQQAHYEQALAELAGLTAVTNSAMADTQRSEREIEEMRKTISKMTDVYQERITAVEDKYASLQEIHAGLMLEFSRRK
jgi:hypothetical protein